MSWSPEVALQSPSLFNPPSRLPQFGFLSSPKFLNSPDAMSRSGAMPGTCNV